MSYSVTTLTRGFIIDSGIRKYKIESVLGQGGFGITYLATARVKVDNVYIIGRFAIKEHFLSSDCERDDSSQVIYSSPAKDRVENSRRDFIAEAKRLHKIGIGHPNIVKVNEVFDANNTSYYIMEYLDGESLRDYVRRNRPLDPEMTINIMSQVVDTVKYLHRNRITHLDIKPDNIMLVEGENGELRPVVIDFGLSKHYDKNGKPTSQINVLGCSDGYAPIEQYAGIQTFSPSTDYYALGATVWFCLTGKDPQCSFDTSADKLIADLPVGVPVSVKDFLSASLKMRKEDRLLLTLKGEENDLHSLNIQTQGKTVPHVDIDNIDRKKTKVIGRVDRESGKSKRFYCASIALFLLSLILFFWAPVTYNYADLRDYMSDDQYELISYLGFPDEDYYKGDIEIDRVDIEGKWSIKTLFPNIEKERVLVRHDTPQKEYIYLKFSGYYPKEFQICNGDPDKIITINTGKFYLFGDPTISSGLYRYEVEDLAVELDIIAVLLLFGSLFFYFKTPHYCVFVRPKLPPFFRNSKNSLIFVASRCVIILIIYVIILIISVLVSSAAICAKEEPTYHREQLVEVEDETAITENETPADEELALVNTPVDLGLKSGVQWAKYNLGATKENLIGYYYFWGQNQGYDTAVSWNEKAWDKNIYGEKDYDAATYALGPDWSLPTYEDFKELKLNCKWEIVNQGGVSGYKVTGPNGNSIFLPFQGILSREKDSSEFLVYEKEALSHYWTGSASGAGPGWFFIIYKEGSKSLSNNGFDEGNPIRPVYKAKRNTPSKEFENLEKKQ